MINFKSPGEILESKLTTKLPPTPQRYNLPHKKNDSKKNITLKHHESSPNIQGSKVGYMVTPHKKTSRHSQPANHPRHSSPCPGGSLDPCINKDKKLGSWCLGWRLFVKKWYRFQLQLCEHVWGWKMRKKQNGFLRNTKGTSHRFVCLNSIPISSKRWLRCVCRASDPKNKHERMKPWKAILLRPMGYEIYIPWNTVWCHKRSLQSAHPSRWLPRHIFWSFVKLNP